MRRQNSQPKPHKQASLSAMHTLNPSKRTMNSTTNKSGRDASVWSAVALQQHMARQFKLETAPREHQSVHTWHHYEGDRAEAPKLSLAQRMGLAEKPPPPPTELEWQSAVTQSHLRSDYAQPCAICHTPMGLQKQTILSCSHVFHTECIKRFEEFVRRSRGDIPRSCPICRREHYHCRRHTRGEESYRTRCIALVQGLWRGKLARRKYVKLRIKKDPKFAADWYYGRLKAMADHYTALAEVRAKEVDAFLEGLDRERELALLCMMGPSQWRDVMSQLLARGLSQCPICMQPNSAEHAGHRESCVLSCSHCFHTECMDVYEVYIREGHHPRCPVCRAYYLRQRLTATDV